MRPKRLSDLRSRWSGGSSQVLRRSALVGGLLAVLLALAGLAAYLTRPADSASDPSGPQAHPTPSASSSTSTAPPKDDTGRAVADPERTDDPVEFATAAAEVLWTYDTRRVSHAEHEAGLKRWMTREGKYADWSSVADEVPSKELWPKLHDNQQHARGSASEGHFPEAFKTALKENPGALRQAYVYAVTVTGKQSLAWKGSGAGAESRTTTLAVQCRPQHDCALVGVLPEVAP